MSHFSRAITFTGNDGIVAIITSSDAVENPPSESDADKLLLILSSVSLSVSDDLDEHVEPALESSLLFDKSCENNRSTGLSADFVMSIHVSNISLRSSNSVRSLNSTTSSQLSIGVLSDNLSLFCLVSKLKIFTAWSLSILKTVPLFLWKNSELFKCSISSAILYSKLILLPKKDP